MERPERAVRRHDPAEDRAVALLRGLDALYTDEPKLAEPTERLIARLIDLGVEAAALLVIGTLAGVFVAAIGHPVQVAPDAPADPVRSLVSGLAFVVFAGACLAYELGLLGQSIGRRIIRLTVVGEDGIPASRRQLATRTLAWMVPAVVAAELWAVSFPHPVSTIPYFLVLGIGASLFVSMARDNDYRGWHDHVAHTKVVTPR